MKPPTSPDVDDANGVNAVAKTEVESLKAQLEKANAQLDFYKKAHVDAVQKLSAMAQRRCLHYPCTRNPRHVVGGGVVLLCCDHFDAQVLQGSRLMVHLPGTNPPRPTDSHGDLVLYFESQCNTTTRIPGCFPCGLGARLRSWFRKLKPWIVFD